MRRALSFAVVVLSLGGCGADAPTYASCEDDLDCSDPNDACYRLLFDRNDGSRGEGNLCSRGCVEDLDCPLDAVCTSLAGDPSMTRFCALVCTVADDCYADFACTSVEGMDLSLCLP